MKLLFFTVFAIFALAHGAARAEVAIAPLRQVLDNEARKAHFVVSNPTSRILEARISWIDLAAVETGYAPASPDLRSVLSAAPYFEVSPAYFRLEPGARTEIVIRLRKNAKPPRGERRSHLLIETGAPRTLIRKTSNTGLQADMSAGVSVPVILRGKGAAAAELGETRLLRDNDGMLLLSTRLHAQGDHSAYGRLSAAFEPQDRLGGNTKNLLSERENVAVFPDGPERKIDLPLGYFSLGAGKLTLRYEGLGEYAGTVFAERKFDVAAPENDEP
ncbi:MAG: hypothetical protein AAGD92_15620 [Pseudomonadota bacterium]